MDKNRNEDRMGPFLRQHPMTLQEINRRTFLAAGLFATGGLLLDGCGGGSGKFLKAEKGSSTSTAAMLLTLSATRGTVALPTGAAISVKEVVNLFGKSSLSTDSAFDLPCATEAPLLTTAYGPSDKAVLYGFITKEGNALSAQSTAIVLACYVLGVGGYPGEVQNLYRDTIARSPRLAALENAVSAAIIARGEGWLDKNDTALVAALADIYKELSAAALATTRGVILDKTERTSGLQVNADGGGSMTISNYYRRRSYVYVDRVSYKRKETGESVPFKGPILPQPIKISPVKGVSNALANLGLLLGGQRDFYEPVVSDKISIPVNPVDAASTTYTATAVGMGAITDVNGDFSKLTPVQQEGWWEVTVQGLLIDLAAPIITGIVLPGVDKNLSEFANFAGTSGVFKDIISAIAASPDIRAKAQAGEIADAAWDTLLLIVENGTLQNVFLRGVGDFILGTFAIPSSPFGLNGSLLLVTDRAKFLAESGAKLTAFISTVNLGFQVFDTVVSGYQLGYCSNADIFTLEVTNAVAKLNPLDPSVDPIQAPVSFTAVVTNADLQPDALLSYKWSCPCLFGDISDGIHTNAANGTTFDSSSKVLSYAPNGKGSIGNTEVVSVEIYTGGINNRIPVGTATSTVTIIGKATLSPDSPSVGPNDNVTIQALLTGVSPSTDVHYEWVVGNGFGTVAGGKQTTTMVPNVTYLAGEALGSDVLTMTVRDSAGKLLATATANIKVEKLRDGVVNPTLTFEDYRTADYMAAGIGYNSAEHGTVIVSEVFRVEHTSGYYIVRTAPNIDGNRTGFRVNVRDILAATSISDKTPPTKGAVNIPWSIEEPIPGQLYSGAVSHFYRRGDSVYFPVTERGYPFLPSLTKPRVTDAAGAEAWIRENYPTLDIQIVWKSG